MAAVLKSIATDSVDDHPDNPRLVFRDDVIDGIAANLDGEFPQKHALHVRPVGERFQLLAGHHRIRAARKKGLAEVWAWVDDLDDRAAFMELATSNNQGELSPLEIGLHALKAVPLARGGKGKKGGLSEYAERIGKAPSTVSEYRSAGEVLFSLNPSVDRKVFLDKAQHLAAIHSLPRECWAEAARAIGEDSAAKVKERVQKAIEYGNQNGVTAEWNEYLPKHDCMVAVFAGTDPNNFNRLSALASKVATELPEDLASQWRSWLLEHKGLESWDIAQVQAKRIELETVAWGREHSAKDRESVAVLMADPPWRYDFAETDNRQIENQYPTASVEEIVSHIKAPWAPALAENCVLYLWATAPKLKEAIRVMEGWGFDYKTHAVWDKEKIGMGYWFRGQHELLLVGTRGSVSPPEAQNRVSSVFREPRSEHSAKPQSVYEAIEKAFPDAVLGEMYQRTPRARWMGYGNEANGAGT